MLLRWGRLKYCYRNRKPYSGFVKKLQIQGMTRFSLRLSHFVNELVKQDLLLSIGSVKNPLQKNPKRPQEDTSSF